jgi:hypothetical protein
VAKALDAAGLEPDAIYKRDGKVYVRKRCMPMRKASVWAADINAALKHAGITARVEPGDAWKCWPNTLSLVAIVRPQQGEQS